MKEKHYRGWWRGMLIVAIILILLFGYGGMTEEVSSSVFCGWLALLFIILYLHRGQRDHQSKSGDRD